MCFASRQIFLRASRHTFLLASRHNSSILCAQKFCRGCGTARALTCTKLCGGQLAQNCALDPTPPSIIAITKTCDKITSQQTSVSAHKHCAQITSQQTAVLRADIVHRSHHNMLHISRHTNKPCNVSTTCVYRGRSAALAHIDIEKSRPHEKTEAEFTKALF